MLLDKSTFTYFSNSTMILQKLVQVLFVMISTHYFIVIERVGATSVFTISP